MIYFDQAATSFPKPPGVAEAMAAAVNEYGANPGRGSHAMARKAAQKINQTREKAADLFGATDPRKVLFFSNATGALNQAIKGFPFQAGDHVITSCFEHNSIRRPLEFLRKTKGIEVTNIEHYGDDQAFLAELQRQIKPSTKLLAITHASNVTGQILPVETATKIIKNEGITVLIDASQTAGHLAINMSQLGVDLLAFSGHKGLMGPQGTGVLIVEGNISLQPLLHGGTGSHSLSVDQPDQWPEKLESGTLNTPGIAGLYAALSAFETREKTSAVSRETVLIEQLVKGLEKIEGVTVYGISSTGPRVPVTAFNIRGIPSEEIAMVLDSHYEIAVRGGLHCSPATHNLLGTTEQGAVRVSLGIYNTEEEIEAFLAAIKEISKAYMEM